MASTPRLYDGFDTLDGGMDSGKSPSLIRVNQVAAASNITMRGAFAKTRPPWRRLWVTLPATFSGVFQGMGWYQGDDEQAGPIVCVGGYLYRFIINQDTATVTDITPRLIVMTAAAFVVPAIAGSVTVPVNSADLITIGTTIQIGGFHYTVSAISGNDLTLVNVDDTAGKTVASGATISNNAGTQLIEIETLPPSMSFVYLYQAENYMIILASQQAALIYDGSATRKATEGEIPSGVLGAYVWGRNWIVENSRRSFVAGDLVYSPSGSADLGFRDAILKFTENDFLNEGGSFAVPISQGAITAMNALATQDTSLGQGNLLVGTTNMVFSVNTPVDRTTWKFLQYPIQTVALIDYGPQGPRSAASVNGDLWYRSADGFRSFVVARRDINVPGNTPISSELDVVLRHDTADLLFYGSGIYFDGKFIHTLSPVRTDSGVLHQGLAVINFELLYSLSAKDPPAWEGVHSGLNIFQICKGQVANEERAFALAWGDGGNYELWELMPDGAGYNDINNYVSHAPPPHQSGPTTVRVPIYAWLESRSLSFGNPSQLKKLLTAELFLDEIADSVTVKISFRPNQYPVWIPWATVPICATVSQCAANVSVDNVCTVWQQAQTQYAARVMLPAAPETCVDLVGIPANTAYEFQFKIEICGHARIRRFRAHALAQDDVSEGACPPQTATCQVLKACDENWFLYNAHNATCPPVSSALPVRPPSPPPTPPPTFGNAQQSWCCTAGGTLVFTGVLPSWITLDQPNNCLRVPVNKFYEYTQADANATALQALTDFVAAGQASGAIQCQFLSAEVTWCCSPGNTIAYSDPLPAWITLDVVNNCLVGAAGTFVGSSQANADSQAQNALDTFATAAVNNSVLTCSPPAPSFVNVEVYWTCPGGTTIVFTGVRPAWITVDYVNNRLVGAAGTYSGVSQVAADTAAQTAIDDYATVAQMFGALDCTTPPPPPATVNIYGNLTLQQIGSIATDPIGPAYAKMQFDAIDVLIASNGSYYSTQTAPYTGVSNAVNLTPAAIAFTPTQRDYVNLAADATGQDFLGVNTLGWTVTTLALHNAGTDTVSANNLSGSWVMESAVGTLPNGFYDGWTVYMTASQIPVVTAYTVVVTINWNASFPLLNDGIHHNGVGITVLLDGVAKSYYDMNFLKGAQSGVITATLPLVPGAPNVIKIQTTIQTFSAGVTKLNATFGITHL